MKLYHGSKYSLKKLSNKQATNGGFENVPEEELQNGIYLTPNYEFAVAMAARPNGGTRIDDRKIAFENEELFNPEEDIFIYVFNTEDEQFKDKDLEFHNKDEYMVKGELVPSEVKQIKAKEVFQYYELSKWSDLMRERPENKELKFKIK